MIVVDSSVWIELMVQSPLVAELCPLFPDQTAHVVPTLVQFELTKWLRREVSEDAANAFIAYSQDCVVAPLTTDIALTAVDMAAKFKINDL